MGIKRGEEALGTDLRAAVTDRIRVLVGHEQSRSRVVAFKYKPFAKYFIPSEVACVCKNGHGRKRTFRKRHRVGRRRRVLKKEKIANPWGFCNAKGAFLVSHPEITSHSENFLGTVVEVVSETSALRLQLYCRDKLVISKDNDVPILLGPVVSGDRDRPVEENLRLSESRLYADFTYKFGEAVKLLSSCDLTACTCVASAASFLGGSLLPTRFPIERCGLLQFSLKEFVGVRKCHAYIIPFFAFSRRCDVRKMGKPSVCKVEGVRDSGTVPER